MMVVRGVLLWIVCTVGGEEERIQTRAASSYPTASLPPAQFSSKHGFKRCHFNCTTIKFTMFTPSSTATLRRSRHCTGVCTKAAAAHPRRPRIVANAATHANAASSWPRSPAAHCSVLRAQYRHHLPSNGRSPRVVTAAQSEAAASAASGGEDAPAVLLRAQVPSGELIVRCVRALECALTHPPACGWVQQSLCACA